MFASIPRLQLYAKGDTIDAAIDSLDQKRNLLEEQLKEADQLDDLDLTERKTTTGTSRITTNGVGIFAMKAGIVVTFISVAVIVAGAFIISKVERAVDNAVYAVQSRLTTVKIGGSQFWSGLEAELDRAAQPGRDMPEEKKQKILADVRIIVGRWRPLVNELTAIVAEQNTAKPQSAGQAK